MRIRQYIFVYFIYYIGLFISVLSRPTKIMTIYDVGQGDAISIAASRQRVLVDGGGSFEIERYLDDNIGLFNRFDQSNIFLTHPHADHLVGINRLLLHSFKNTLTFNDVEYDSKLNFDFMELSKNNYIKNAVAGDIFYFKDFTLTVLWPTEKVLKSNLDNVNNYSVVLLLDAGEFEALLTGDAEIDALSSIDFDYLSSLIDMPLEVLKVPHHGSRTGLFGPMYDILEPKYCVISVGVDNSYGLPHAETLDYLIDVGCEILRTDQDGSIKFDF